MSFPKLSIYETPNNFSDLKMGGEELLTVYPVIMSIINSLSGKKPFKNIYNLFTFLCFNYLMKYYKLVDTCSGSLNFELSSKAKQWAIDDPLTFSNPLFKKPLKYDLEGTSSI